MERVRRQDGVEPTPEEALAWATRNGYRALGIPDGGWLGPGNLADLIVVDLRRAHLTPALRVVSCFVHQGQAGDVEAVMVGRPVAHARRPRADARRARAARRGRPGRRGARGARLFEERPDLPPSPGLDLRPS